MDFQQLSCAPHLPAAQGAALKEADLVRWLQNKLQDREKWAGRECAQLVSREMVEELRTCFSMLENSTRLKIILSFMYLNPKYSKAWKDSLEGLLNNARRDADDWVEIVAELFRNVPMAKGTATMTDEVQSYQKMIEDLKIIAQEHEDAGNLRSDPRSMEVCSTEIINGLFEREASPEKHFVLKKKPKSEALLSEMKKQCEILNNQKRDRKEAITSGCLPIKIRSTRREADNSLPMRGIPNQNQVKMSQGFTYEPKKFPRPTIKREGGVKLLDISDLPPPLKQRAKAEKEDEKRRVMEVKELQRKAKEDAKKVETEARRSALMKEKDAARAVEEKKQQMEKLSKVSRMEPIKLPQPGKRQEGGGIKRPSVSLISPPPAKIAPHIASTSRRLSEQIAHSSRGKAVNQLMRPVQESPVQLPPEQKPLALQPSVQRPAQQPPDQRPVQRSVQRLVQQPVQQQMSQQVQIQQPIVQPLHHANAIQVFQMQQAMQAQQAQQIQQAQQAQQIQQVQQIQMQQVQQAFNQPQPQVIIQNMIGNQPIQLPGPSQIQQPQQHYILAPSQAQNPTIELFQDIEVARKCHEILSTANALDDRGRDVVIQFMKGLLRIPSTLPKSNESIMTLKLSENVEDGLADGRIQKLKVEVFFQMDLSNGEWKRLRKCRLLENDEMNEYLAQQHRAILASQQQQFLPHF